MMEIEKVPRHASVPGKSGNQAFSWQRRSDRPWRVRAGMNAGKIQRGRQNIDEMPGIMAQLITASEKWGRNPLFLDRHWARQ
jgi:hypothetical protein